MSSPNEIKINECQADLDELKGLLEKSTREKVKELLKANVEKVEADLARLKRDEQIRLAKLNAAANGNTGAYTKKIDTYGWDQSEKFVKIYITSLGDTSKVKESDLITNFTET